MDNTLTALVSHINSGKAAIGLSSVQAYAGELAPDAKKLIKKTARLPCHVHIRTACCRRPDTAV